MGQRYWNPNLSFDKKSSQVAKTPSRFQLLNLDEQSHSTSQLMMNPLATYSIVSCQSYPELENLPDLLSYCVFMKCFEWFWISKCTSLYFCHWDLNGRHVSVGWCSFWHLQARSQGMSSPASPANVRVLSKGYGQKVTFQMLFYNLFILVFVLQWSFWWF